ncbi:MAG: radical SAM protein, partial [Candidatus Scalindua sp.]|nr:radical SAM protein [Candidatus Scalindua sp.]
MKSIPHVISWNLTKACNLLCDHCYLLADNVQPIDQTDTNLSSATPSLDIPDFNQIQCGASSTADELDTDTALKVIDQIAELNPNLILILTGGEPLLRKDIFDLSRHAAGKGMMVLLGTNACLIDDEMAKKLKDNGFSGIGISLDSVHPEIHDSIRGAKGSWKKAVEG